MNRHDTFLRWNGKLAGALAMGVLLFVSPTVVHADLSASQRPRLRQMLRSQGWDGIDNWKQIREQAQNQMDCGRYRNAAQLYASAQKILERQKGMQHPLTLRNRAELANALLRQGSPDGEKMLREVYAMQLQRLKPDHPDVLFSRHLLANLAIVRNDLSGAEMELRDVITQRTLVLGPEHADTLASHTNLAHVLISQGRHDEAEQHLEHVLEIELQNSSGNDDLQTCAAREPLAACYYDRGKFAGALEQFRIILAVANKEQGARHNMTTQARQKVASALYHLGKYAESEREMSSLVKDLIEWKGSEDDSVLILRAEVAESLRAQGKVADAVKEVREVMAVYIRRDGETSEWADNRRTILASMLMDLNQIEEAEKLIRQSVDFRRKKLGIEHPLTVSAAQTLASCLAEKGEFRQALDSMRGILELRERVLGPNHMNTWYTRTELADVLRRLNRPDEALPLFEGAVAFYEAARGPLHPFTLKQRNNLSITLTAAGRVEEGVALQKTLLKQREEVLGPDHQDTIKSRINVAFHCMGEGKLDEAETRYKEVIATAERVAGPSHFLTNKAQHGYVLVLCALRRPAEAEAVVRAALKAGQAADLPSADIHAFHEALALTLVQQGRGSEAVEFAAEAENLLTAQGRRTPEETLATSNIIAWVKMATGREAEALAQLDQSTSMLRSWKATYAHHPTLIIKCMQAVALRMQGKTEQWQKILAEVDPVLQKSFWEGEPILQLGSLLKKPGAMSLPVMMHAVRFSRPRPFQPPQQKSIKPEAADPNISPEKRAELRRLVAEAESFAERGMHAEAMSRHEQYTTRTAEVLGTNNDGRVAFGHLMAAQEGILAGKMSRAREHCRKAVTMMKDWSPEVIEQFSWSLQGFANSLMTAGNVQAANILTTQVAELCLEILGEAHQGTLLCKGLRVEVLLAARAPEAEEMLLQLAADLEKHKGAEDISTLRVNLLKLRWLLDHQKFREAHLLSYAMEEPVKKVFGADSSQNQLVREAAAVSLEGQGLRNMAVSEFRMVLADVERISGEESLETVNVRFRFAMMLQRASAFPEALELHQRNLKILSNPTTENHPLMTDTRLQLAVVLLTLQRPAEALPFAKHAAVVARQLFGPDHEIAKHADRLVEIARQQSGKR